MTHEDRIAEILGRWQDARDDGRFVDIEALCAEHPDLADELRSRLAALNVIEQAFAESRILHGETPKRLGEFEIVREVGRGGMGVVYEARQTSMNRTVALKVLFPGITGSRRAIERFQREAQAAGRVQHTNIVPVYQLSREDGTWYYAMELVEGSSLATLLRRLRELGEEPGEEHRTLLTGTIESEDGSLPEQQLQAPETSSTLGTEHGTGAYHREVARLFAGVAEALQAAHDEGVIHRDLKPSNLILDSKGVLKIVDFGIARIGGDTGGMTITGEILGTPVYMSPEQARAKSGVVDHRTDIYSLGASLYEVLTLRTPFTGTSFPELYEQILTTQPIAPRTHSAGIPRDLETVVLKAMEKSPAQRYESAGDLARDLRAFADGFDISARRVGALTRTWRTVKRNPVRSALIACLLVAVSTAGYLGWRRAAEERRRVDLEYAALLAGIDSLGTGPWSDDDPLEQYFGEQRKALRARRLVALDRAITLAPNRPEAWLRRGVFSTRNQAERDADLHRAEACGASPRAIQLGRSLVLRDNEQREAASALEASLATEVSTSPMERYLEAILQFRRAEWRAAHATLSALLEEQGVGDFERNQALFMRAELRGLLGDREGSIEDLAAYQRHGGSSIYARVRTAWHWYCLDRRATAEGLFASVLEDVRRDDRVDAWQDLADACARARARPWSVETTRLAVQHHPDVLSLLLAHFRALRASGWHAQALAVAQQAVKLAPNAPMAIYARGSAHYGRGELWKAWLDLKQAAALRPDDAEVVSATASVLAAMKQYRRALDRSERQIELAPNSSAGWRHKAWVLRAVRKFEEAVAAYDRAYELNPARISSLVDKATTLRMANRLPEARRVLDAALAHEALDAQTLTRAAAELNDQKRYAEALPVVVHAIDLDPVYARAHFVRAFSLYWLERMDAATQACEQGLAIDPGDRTLRKFRIMLARKAEGEAAALRRVEQMLAARPHDARIWQLKGHQLIKMDRVDEGLSALRKATEIDPGNPALFLDLFQALFLEARLDEALAAARAALRVAPEDAHTLLTVAGALNTLERFDEALELLTKAEKLDPENGGVQAFRAFALRQKGEYDAALATATRGVELDPYECSTWEHRAQILFALGRHEDALADAERAYALAPGGPLIGPLRAHLLSAVGRHEEALTAAQEIVQLHPRNVPALNVLADVLGVRGDWQGALAALEKADSLDPNNAAILYSLGHAFLSLGRAPEAVSVLERAAALKPHASILGMDRVRVLHDLARGHDALGRSDDALKVLRQATELQPRYAGIYHDLLQALLGAGRFEECVTWAEKARARFPDESSFRILEVRALGALGLTKEAEALLAEIEAAPPTAPSELRLWHETLAMAGRHADVVRVFDRVKAAYGAALEKTPGEHELATGLVDARIYTAYALVKLGRLQEADRQYRTAHSELEALKKRLPDDMTLRSLAMSLELKHGYCLQQLGREAEADAANRRGVEQGLALEAEGISHRGWAVAGAGALHRVGWCEAMEGRFEEAAAYARRTQDHRRRYAGAIPPAHGERLDASAKALLAGADLAAGSRPMDSLEDRAELAYFLATIGHARRAYETFVEILALPEGRTHADGMHLYNGACAACVLAGDTESAEETAALRAQALDWLQQFVEDWKQRILEPPPDSSPEVRQALAARFEEMRKHALQDPDLADLRDVERFKALFDHP